MKVRQGQERQIVGGGRTQEDYYKKQNKRRVIEVLNGMRRELEEVLTPRV